MQRVTGAQGSDSWVRARCGIPTASRFKDILTQKKLELSKTSGPYMCELLAEWIFGEPIEIETTGYMERGVELEDVARKAYTLQTGNAVEQVGLCLTDSGEVGCSPDGLIGDDGGLEIKVPGLKNHIRYWLDPQALVEDYKLQLHGSIWVCERQWWDIISFNPSLPDVIVRVERDTEITNKISDAVCGFGVRLYQAQRVIAAKGQEIDQRPIEARQRIETVAA